MRGRAGGGEAVSADGASLEFRGRSKGSDAGPHGLSLLRSERWRLVTVQEGPTQIDVRQPVLTGPDTLQHDEDSLDFVVCASLAACFSMGLDTHESGPIYLVHLTEDSTGDLLPSFRTPPPPHDVRSPPPPWPRLLFTSKLTPVRKSCA